ncbi:MULTISPECIES: sigma-54 interaction domain-containing protein [Marinomonas]|uniref:Sigma-54-dependent Fis family transcriptional regulator n=1 Tax=Marinomonas arctica TaxID=383750 RepID=A0A7H1J2V8_9GAMM|nr:MULTISPECIES: sigma-54 dependent transcriptional regulator [Marinomonas]MCS7486536.1 ATPase AAA [Marinomonas sp. BSi20414]QNT04824.1 sigma-54-dependent Fis family transcriptional regulator [Marinomonas arctica]GGN31112.1 sigma-54-dependent Fis family transcriptional regulator [Marinomonas arctica]
MSSPKLFMHVQDPLLASNLLSLKSVRQYELNISQQGENWLDQLTNAQCDVALIEVNSLHDIALKALVDSPILYKTEFLFFSRGTPDPILDCLMRKGAGFHYRAPFNIKLIQSSLEEVFCELNRSHENICTQTSYLDQFGLLVGSSTAMHSLYRTIRKVAATKANVFIVGESGTGKELIANTLHVFSQRAEGPFVAINCGALSPELIDSELFGHVKGAFTGAHKDHQGVFEQAEGGTLFLDEVTEMPYEQQVKLLRVLESGEYKPVGAQQVKMANVRIISATNRTPKDAIRDEIFREDLYFRLAQFPIMAPRLRDREGDACGLAQHFLAYRNTQDGQRKQLSSQSLEKIGRYTWPGNVRELKHAIERAYILADDIIHPEHLITHDFNDQAKHDATYGVPTGMRLDDMEKIAILKTLKKNDGNKTDTANQLGISIKTLYNKLDKYEHVDFL